MLVACGLNHKTAPLAIREKCYFPTEKTPESLLQLVQVEGIREAVILSTCNRTEIYCESESSESVINWLANHHHAPAANMNEYLYHYQNKDTVNHATRVASGLDSMILGEPQIFGQVKEAVAVAEKTGVLGKQLRTLFQHVFSVAKQIRTDTGINANPVSLGFVVVHLAKRIFSDLSQCKVLLVGGGETIQLVAKHLYGNNIQQFCIANRTLSRVQSFADSFNAKLISLEDIAKNLANADIIITATHAALPIIGKGIVETALKKRKHRPMLMIDLAVPRNIEPEVQQLADVYWYCIDSLQTLLEDNRNKRVDAIHMAEAIIESQTLHFIATLRAAQANDVIKDYRYKIKKLRDQMVIKSLQELSFGDDPKEILEKLADKLVNKIMHDPSFNLRNAVYHGDFDLIPAARKLFALEK